MRALGAAALLCGLVLGSLEPAAKDLLPESGPLAEITARRLLLVDAAHPGSRIVAVGDRGYIVYSDDGGKSWQRAKSPQAPLLTAVFFIDAKHGWAVGHDAVILATQDGGETWVQQFSAPTEQRPLLDVLFLDASNGIAIGAYGAYYETTDGGKSWNARKILEEDKHLNAITKIAEGKLLILGEAGTILASDDAGKKWTAVASPYKGSLFAAVVGDEGAIVACGMRGRIYRSTDAGRSWKQVDSASQASLMGATRMPDGAIVLAGAAGTALISRDNGQSFQPLPTGSTRALSAAVVGAPGEVLLLGESGAKGVDLQTSHARAQGAAPPSAPASAPPQGATK